MVFVLGIVGTKIKQSIKGSGPSVEVVGYRGFTVYIYIIKNNLKNAKKHIYIVPDPANRSQALYKTDKYTEYII